MAKNEPTSAHLDSMIHVYDNGSTARLYVTPWDRNTVADGYWQTVNTIQPLINRDIYLADALDKLANKHAVYSAGFGINISNEDDGTHKISVKPDVEFDNVPIYHFDSNYFTYTTEGNTATIGFKLDEDGFISATEDGLFCNIDYLLHETINTSSYSAITADVTTAYTYDYSTATLDVSAVTSLPITLAPETIYLVG